MHHVRLTAAPGKGRNALRSITISKEVFIMSREKRIEALRQELSSLKAELRKARGQYKRATIQDEIRAVCRELVRQQQGP